MNFKGGYFRGSSGNSGKSRELPEAPGKSDSLPASRQGRKGKKSFSKRASVESLSGKRKAHEHKLFKFSSYKMGVSMNSWFLVTGRIYFKKKVF